MRGSLMLWFLPFIALPGSAFGDCFTSGSDCRAGCSIEMVGAIALAGTTGSSYDASTASACMTACDATRDACVAEESRRAEMERQQASAAASAQAAQQASATASTQIESANQIAAQVAAESAVETQIDAFLRKGLELLDEKN